MDVKPVEPPSCSSAVANVVLIGRNRRGSWIVREQNGLFGGLFVNRAEAVKYALFENGRHPEPSSNYHLKSSLTPEPEAPVQIQETAMIDPCFALDQEQAVDTMIALTHPSTLGGIIITGSECMELYLVLRRRGYNRVATPVTCRAPKRQHAVGLVTGQDAVAALVQASPFLSTNSNVAVLIDSRDGELAMKIRHKLQQMGFRIEAGVRCRRGLVLAADRRGFSQLELAA